MFFVNIDSFKIFKARNICIIFIEKCLLKKKSYPFDIFCLIIYLRYIEERSFRRFVEACLEETVVVYVDHLLIQVNIREVHK